VYFRAVNNTTYDESLYKYTPADQQLRRVTQGAASRDGSR
jgi:hypothetical protein